MQLTFQEFLAGKMRNWWVEEPNIRAYVRKSFRVIEDKVEERVIDLANVEVDDRHRGTGVFRDFIQRMERDSLNAGYEVIFLETVLEQRLLGFYESQGYTRIPFDAFNTMQIHFFKRLRHANTTGLQAVSGQAVRP